MEQRLRRLMSDLFRLPESSVGAELTLANTAAWDSLRHMELIASLEREFGVELSADEIVSMVSWRAITDVLQQKGVR